MTDYKNQVEAILFASGRLMDIDTLISLTGASSKKVVQNSILKLVEEYQQRDSPLMILEEKDGWKLTVQEKYLPLVRRIVSDMELPKSLLETLAVIAWKSPVLQSEVVDVRHNKAYEHIKELEDLGFITKEPNGRSYLLRVSEKFFQYFDIEGKKDIKEIFKTIKETPMQRKVDDFEGLDVYETVQKGEEPKKTDSEHLGRLEVYEEKTAEASAATTTKDGEFDEEEPGPAEMQEEQAAGNEEFDAPAAEPHLDLRMPDLPKTTAEQEPQDVIGEMDKIHKGLEKSLEEDDPEHLEKIGELQRPKRSKEAREDLYGNPEEDKQ